MLQLVPKIFLFALVGDRGAMMFNSGGALLMLWGGDWGCDSLKMLGGGFLQLFVLGYNIASGSCLDAADCWLYCTSAAHYW